MPSRDFDSFLLTHVPAGARKERVRKRAWPELKQKARPYAELRSASAFSFLDGASLPEDLIDLAAQKDIPAMALIDTNGVYGAPRFYGAAKKAGLRAIVGAEVVLDNEQSTPGLKLTRMDAARSNAREQRLTLLVESHTGYRNLCKLLTAGALDRPKAQARFSWDLIEKHAEGLHCITGGDEGPIAHALAKDGLNDAEKLLHKISGIFSGRTHIELQRHHRRDEEHRNIALVDLARRFRLPLIATNGVRYARAGDKELHDVLTCIREGRNVDSAGRLLGVNRERFIKGADEMAELFADLPEALDNSWKLANTLDFTLANLGYQFPEYPLPPGESAMSFLRKIAWNGATTRFRPLTAKAQAQIEKELATIEKLDLAGYFLIVWDIVQFCQREKILVQGRGSAANSAVCYALSITAVDPVSMELLFERFLSEERGEWPDIDLDLPSGDQRERVIQHVYKTYGLYGSAMTANVITYRDRSSAREVGKALGFSLEQADKLSKTLGTWNFGEIRERAESMPQELAGAGFDPEDRRVQHFMRLQMQIQNLPRHLGQHSGGMVMAKGRLDEVVPLEPAAMPGRVVIQWDKDDCADLGIIKVDLLGLGMLAAIEEMIPLIRTNEGIDVDLAHLPQDDPRVYKMLNEADTVGMFQVESRAQMASLPRNAPAKFYDIVVQVAIIRPGPIVGGMVKPFFDRRQGKAPLEYPHPCLEPILRRTLGVPLFQEQLLRIAMVAADFTGGEAEELRRAMGFKRSMERMGEIEKRLRAGMTKNGIDLPAQDQIVKSITSFALYGFPESHAASFALIAYASAYLKAHHPAAFYIALMNAWPMGFYHPATLIKDAERHGVTVLPVDVNHSGWHCRWEGGAVRMGMKFVKGLRESAARAIETASPFCDANDLARRAMLRGDQLTKLAFAGALASLGLKRRAALWQAAQAAKPAGELFEESPVILNRRHPGGVEDGEGPPAGSDLKEGGPSLSSAPSGHRRLKMTASPLQEMSAGEETLADYEAMSLTTGPHLLAHFRPQLQRDGVFSAKQLTKLANGRRVATAGAVIVRQRPGTAKGFVFLTLEDETGISQAIVKPDLFRDHRALIVGSPGLIVEGILQNEDGQCSVRAEKFWSLDGIGEVASHDFH
ncbi:MAG: error-prone polymerase [Thermoanaerobaculia bacterium]|jgi:error-prone DNA polymerase|nr:error-prone polymerase [Thermoanaerobaculia bacterium]